MKLVRTSSILRSDFIRKFVSKSFFYQRKSINGKPSIQYDNFLKHHKQLVHVGSRYNKCRSYSKQSISDQGSGERKMVSTTTDEISKTENGVGRDVEKSASQLKKEAKRLAKLEKFSKKQEQAHQKAVKEVIGNGNKLSEVVAMTHQQVY